MWLAFLVVVVVGCRVRGDLHEWVPLPDKVLFQHISGVFWSNFGLFSCNRGKHRAQCKGPRGIDQDGGRVTVVLVVFVTS